MFGYCLQWKVSWFLYLLNLGFLLNLKKFKSDFVVGRKEDSSVLGLVKVPAVIMTGLVVVVVSSTWGFLDPTLEPHLRQVCEYKIRYITLIYNF